jgi:pimeloyl-ACP methyl ester carboxylesterase
VDFEYVVLPAFILLIGVVVIWLSVGRIRSLSVKYTTRWRRVAERSVLSAIVLAAAVVAGSASFNTIARLWFRSHNPPPGEMYIVDGHKMHMYCAGSGAPTIVLDAGLGDDAVTWAGVQPELAKTTRVCAYDRAGFGWSDVGPAPRDADHIATELHGLLRQAKIGLPIVLMGHSIAGIYMRDYAAHYPEDLAGMVFVDGSTPMQQENPAIKAMMGKGPPPWVIALVANAVFSVGIPRLMGICSRTKPGLDARSSRLQAEDHCELHVDSSLSEAFNMERSGLETQHSGPYGSLPILILSHDPEKTMAIESLTQRMAEPVWSQMQEDLKKLSTRSRRIIAIGSAHSIQTDRADLIEKEVPLFIRQIRGTAPQATNYGSTITE